MAKDLLSTFPQKFGFGKKEDAVQSFPSSVASGGYRPRKQSAPVEHQMSMSLINKGLLNPTGENNCFLNSAVQILWHIDVFRRSFRNLKGHTCVEEACIFCALKELFKEFQHSGQSAIPPDILRKAMAECYGQQNRFQLGLMDDAAECFEKLLEQIHLHLTGSEDMESCGVPHCLSHQKFALTILERTECTCGATSEPLSFVQFVHYISSSAIVKETQKFAEREKGARAHKPTSNRDKSPDRDKGSHAHKTAHQDKATEDKGSHAHLKPNQHERSPLRQMRSADVNPPASSDVSSTGSGARRRLFSASQDHFGRILNKASSTGEYRKCPDYDRCKKTVSVKRILLNCPDVVCLGMIWDSDQPSVDDIMSVVYSIGLKLQLNDLFDHVFSDGANINQYELTALIAYYGRHYSTFSYHSKMHEWIYFDDARFRKVGAEWDDVCEEIRKAHYQPLLLVYTNPFAEEINLSEAPQNVTKVHQRDLQSSSKNAGSSSKNAGSSSSSKTTVPVLSSINEELSTSTSTKIDPPVAPRSTHTIDPMTLSLRPISRANALKSTTPVVSGNRASATPTPKGSSTLSATEAMKLSDRSNSGENDLMTFSISPVVLGKMAMGTQTTKVPSKEKSASLAEKTERQGDVSVGDLIEFSLTPAMLDKFKSRAVYNPGSRSRLFDDTRRSPSHSPSASPFQSPSISPVRSRKSQDAHSTHLNPSSTTLTQVHSSPTHSPTQFRSGTGSTSKPPHSQSSAANVSSGLNPKWDHYGEQNSSLDILVPPQKLLPKQQQQQQQQKQQQQQHQQQQQQQQQQSSVSVASKSPEHQRPIKGLSAVDQQNSSRKSTSSRTGKSRGEEKKSIEVDWTLVTKADSSSQDDSAALRQLRRIVSQPGFDDVGEALVPMGRDMKSPELAISSISIPPDDGKSQQPQASTARAIPPRSKADPLPSVPPADKSNQGAGFHGKWFPAWEEPPKNRDVHSKPENAKSKPNKKHDKLDYADLDLVVPGYEQVRTKFPELKPVAGTVDYAEIAFQPPTSGSSMNKKKAMVIEDVSEDYIRLVDVETNINKMKKTSAMPLGYDPDYAIPDQVLNRLQHVHQVIRGVPKGTEHASSRQPQASNPLVKPHSTAGSKDKEGSQPSSHRDSSHHQVVSPHSGDLTDLSKNLSGKGKDTYQEGLSMVAVAKATKETDTTVAMMLFQKAAGLFLEVLQDPSVRAAPAVYDRIKMQREEATKNSVLLQKKGHHGNSWETCKRCGLQRYLDDNMLCGPCQLREKLKKN